MIFLLNIAIPLFLDIHLVIHSLFVLIWKISKISIKFHLLFITMGVAWEYGVVFLEIVLDLVHMYHQIVRFPLGRWVTAVQSIVGLAWRDPLPLFFNPIAFIFIFPLRKRTILFLLQLHDKQKCFLSFLIFTHSLLLLFSIFTLQFRTSLVITFWWHHWILQHSFVLVIFCKIFLSQFLFLMAHHLFDQSLIELDVENLVFWWTFIRLYFFLEVSQIRLIPWLLSFDSRR